MEKERVTELGNELNAPIFRDIADFVFKGRKVVDLDKEELIIATCYLLQLRMDQ